MKTTMKICMLAAVVALVGCASQPPQKKEIAKIDIGMTIQEVSAILGAPKEKQADRKKPNSSCLGFELVEWSTLTVTHKTINKVGFEDGRVSSIGWC
jgi:hypothetical protein